MIKFNNKLFERYFIKHHLKPSNSDLDYFYSCLETLERLKNKKFLFGITSQEMMTTGTLILDIEKDLQLTLNGFTYKIVDLFSGIISSVNSTSYSSALAISRSLLEHCAMLILKYERFLKFLNDGNYAKLSKELAYWSVDYKEKEILLDSKRTHVNDALRHFAKYISEHNDLPYTEKDILKEYDEFSEMTHPASISLLMYHTFTREVTQDDDNSQGIGEQFNFSENSERIQSRVFNLIAWPILFFAHCLTRDIYPNIAIKTLQVFFDQRESMIDFFKNNPEIAKNLQNQIFDHKKIQEFNDRKKITLN